MLQFSAVVKRLNAGQTNGVFAITDIYGCDRDVSTSAVAVSARYLFRPKRSVVSHRITVSCLSGETDSVFTFPF